MRRGLISWSKTELPTVVFDRRVERVRAAMAAAQLDALVLYTNNTRPGAVQWLTGFLPYWSEALLVLPRRGGPHLMVGLSKRVEDWIERNAHLAGITFTPRAGVEAGKLLAGAARGAVGVVDLAGLPAGIRDDLVAGGSGLTLVDASPLVERLRAAADPAEIALAVTAATIAHRALAEVSPRHSGIAASIAAVEGEARRLGAEEVYVAAAPDLEQSRRLVRIEGSPVAGRSFALRATVAYKGAWVRMVRTVRRDGADAVARAAERFAAAVAALPDAGGFAGTPSWLVEGCRLAQPLEHLLGSRVEMPLALAPGALVSVQAVIEEDGIPVLLGAPAVLGTDGAAAALLVQPDFALAGTDRREP
jgi:hypothetical protein